MRDVTVRFNCGHTGLVTAAMFDESEEIPLPCRACKPSRIVALIWLGASAAFGVTFYGMLTFDWLIAVSGATGIGVATFFLLLFRK